ncbi:unnamed protein product [Rotaria sp. Silwood1]|nr:unnamed protein product [Rotaria sp. Silwood1]CAF3497449.1 unnamed protein product [Rotaria sp. Silwood1]CAF4805168.1 unnamed protein product [Rotaria sp. Silwood1]
MTIAKDSDIRSTIHLTSLSINDCSDLKMDEIESLLSLLPMLKYLRLLGQRYSIDHQFFDGSRWEELIQSKLPLLNQFHFWFYNSQDFDSNRATVESLIAPFQTPFWLKNKNWFIKCDYEHSKA